MQKARLSLAALALAVGCGSGDSGGPADAGGDSAADARADGDPGQVSCAPERTRVVGSPEQPIEVGTFCDEVVACVADSAAVEALVAVAPDFSCAPDLGVCGGDIACRLVPEGDEIGEAYYAQICRITVLPDPPEEVVCWVFL
jgi:hypothetical protein